MPNALSPMSYVLRGLTCILIWDLVVVSSSLVSVTKCSLALDQLFVFQDIFSWNVDVFMTLRLSLPLHNICFVQCTHCPNHRLTLITRSVTLCQQLNKSPLC